MFTRIVFAAALFAAPPALAAETAWQEVAPDVRLRMISDDVLSPARTTRVAIEIDMPQSYKTYWRVPGETGIPTRIDWAGSVGIGKASVSWPYPTIETSAGLTSYLYHGPTVLPIDLAVESERPVLKASVVMGVCFEICVPVMADFELPLRFATADGAQALRIAQALAETPFAWDRPTPAIGDAAYDAAAQGITVALLDASIDPHSLIASTSDPAVMFGPPQKSPEPDLIFLPLLGDDAQKRFRGGPVQLTFMTERGPYEVSQEVSLAGVTSGGQ
jgi:DsbC/DsbD-like thiol-disulfide interchange protein